ncbi:MAG: hypothetical protein AB7E78_04130 [Porticoccaceae bacterium]
MADEKIDIRITPSFDARAVEGQILGETKSAAAQEHAKPTVTLFAGLHQDLARLHAARQALEQDPTSTPEARAVQLAKTAEKLGARIGQRMTEHLSRLESDIGALEAALSAPVTEQAARPVAQEIRAHFKGLSTSERSSAARMAIQNGDDITATAILGAPPYLSGLQADMQQTLLSMYHKSRNPDSAEKLEVLRRSRDILVNNSALVRGELIAAVGAQPDEAAEWQKRQDVASAAIRRVLEG